MVSIVMINVSFAHQPRLVFQAPTGEIIHIENPEISQAFYGILSGQEDNYQIVSDTGFLLYVSLVVPDISWSMTDFTIDINQGDSPLIPRLDGKYFSRSWFFEKFAWDTYLQWPTREKLVAPGIYTIKISNPEKKGKYSLAIGKKESFPFNEIIHTYKVLPELKIVFFEKPWYTIFLNYVWWFFIAILLVIVVIIWWIIHRIQHKKQR